jgi:HAD superfamily hydrolase (TIGR01509 family)
VQEEDLKEFDEKVFPDMLERRERSGLEFPLSQYFNLLQACFDMRFDGDPDDMAFQCWIRQYEPRLENGAVECLEELRSREIKLGVLSNTILSRKCIHLAMREFGILDFFDAVVCSSEVAYRKPNALCYRAVLGMLRAEAAESAMVGDNLELDIAGAASVGLTTVWYNPEKLPVAGIQPDHVVSELGEVPRVLGLPY